MKKSPSTAFSEIANETWKSMVKLPEDDAEICESSSRVFGEIGQLFYEGLEEGIRVGRVRMEEYRAVLEWLGGEDSPEKRWVRRMIKRENDRNKTRYAIRKLFDKLMFWKRNDW